MNGVLSGVREEGFQAADALPDSKKESKAELSSLLAPEFLLGGCAVDRWQPMHLQQSRCAQ